MRSGARYMTPHWGSAPVAPGGATSGFAALSFHPSGEPLGSLRVELDDQLFLNLRVDDLPCRQRVDQDLQLGRDGLQPRRHRPAPRLGLRHHEWRQVAGLLPDLDDVVFAYPVRGDVDLL